MDRFGECGEFFDFGGMLLYRHNPYIHFLYLHHDDVDEHEYRQSDCYQNDHKGIYGHNDHKDKDQNRQQLDDKYIRLENVAKPFQSIDLLLKLRLPGF